MRSIWTNASLGFLLALSLLGGPVVARAQGLGEAPGEVAPDSPSREPRTFGIASVSHTIQAYAFTGFTAADAAVTGANVFGSRFCAGISCYFEAPVSLPAGASVTSIQLEACDTDATAGVTAGFFRVATLETAVPSALASASTGTPATPAARWSVRPSPPHTPSTT